MEKFLEIWTIIHAFIMEHEWLQGLLIYILAEIFKRFLPSKSKESLMELAGKVVRKFLDVSHVTNKVKVVGTDGEKKVIEANPKKPTAGEVIS